MGGGWGYFLAVICFVKLDLNADIASSARRKQQQQPLRPCTRFTQRERERGGGGHRNVPFRPLCQPVTGGNVSGVNTRTGAVTH